MEEGGIVASQISASSVHFGILGLQRWGPELARLNNQGLVNAWSSDPHDKNPWLEVVKNIIETICGLALLFVLFVSIQKLNAFLIGFVFLMLTGLSDRSAEEDASHWHHHTGSQSLGHS